MDELSNFDLKYKDQLDESERRVDQSIARRKANNNAKKTAELKFASVVAMGELNNLMDAEYRSAIEKNPILTTINLFSPEERTKLIKDIIDTDDDLVL